MRVLVINAGSSSFKHALIDTDTERALSAGNGAWDPGRHASQRAAQAIRDAVADCGQPPAAVGHRVVHGGARLTAPVLIDETVREAIAANASLDALHTQAVLDGIEAASAILPDLPQVACFDTAFHRTLPPAAATYPVPGAWTDRYELRRYGFHGLNVQWCQERAVSILGAQDAKRLIVCHLGSGCSVTAVLDGRSVDTTMGLTPLEGVPMATRSGSVDPGLLLHLLDHGMSREELRDGITRGGGLFGVSGIAGGLRAVEAAATVGDPRAILAYDVFVRSVAGAVAAMSTALGGLDTLVFTAGVGEGSPRLRADACQRLAHLGVTLDPDRNARTDTDRDLRKAETSPHVLVIPAGEEMVIARATRDTIAAACRQPRS